MVQFNSDGSLKLPTSALQKKQENVDRMDKGRFILIRKEVVNFASPKKCALHIRVSDAISDDRFIEDIFRYFNEKAATPTKIVKTGAKEFDVTIGTDFKRCSDCTCLVNRYREFLDGNIIEEKGNCTFEGFRKNFSYDDYFE
jgi:hypothetical protein